jgi:hypothetical protein
MCQGAAKVRNHKFKVLLDSYRDACRPTQGFDPPLVPLLPRETGAILTGNDQSRVLGGLKKITTSTNVTPSISVESALISGLTPYLIIE